MARPGSSRRERRGCIRPDAIEATSAYDTNGLKATLEQLIDFDRINSDRTRFSVGAVNVRTGNFVYFDTATRTIGPEHIMASAALPPGFPAVEIEGEHYWDGGLVSNTPLQWLVDSRPHPSKPCGGFSRMLAWRR